MVLNVFKYVVQISLESAGDLSRWLYVVIAHTFSYICIDSETYTIKILMASEK